MAQVFGTQEKVAYLGDSITAVPSTTESNYWFGQERGLDASLKAMVTNPVTPAVVAPSASPVVVAPGGDAVVVAPTGGNWRRIRASQGFGYSGFTIAQIDAVRAACVTYAPTVVFIEAGTNNTGDAQVEVETMLGHLVAELPGVKLFWLYVFARGSEAWNPDPNAGVVDEVNDSIAAGVAAEAPLSCDVIDIRTPQQAYEAANNLPSPGAANGILTIDGTHLNYTGQGVYSGFVLDALTFTAP